MNLLLWYKIGIVHKLLAAPQHKRETIKAVKIQLK